jgi:hypothetical protein
MRAERVAATSPGLAVFYAGLRTALARMDASPPAAARQSAIFPVPEGQVGILSRNGAVALGIALLVLGLSLGIGLLPRLAAAGFAAGSRSSAQMLRESLVLTLAVVAVCLFLAVLLLRAAV